MVTLRQNNGIYPSFPKFHYILHKTAIKHENYYKGVTEKCTFCLKELESIIINRAISFMRRVYFV